MNTRSPRFPMPKEVAFICDTIASAGEQAYIVGGAMRDMLTGRQVVDFDLATTASPDTVTKLFKKVIPTGIKHGTVTVIVNTLQFEVTTLRGEGTYSDGRRPDHVEFLKDIDADLARRDFTINAIAWDPIEKILHDPFGGSKDLESRVLRAVGDPTERFAEDGLRVLRAARFAATLEFDVDQDTLLAMSRAAPALTKVSNERKKDELVKLLKARRPSLGLRTMHQADVIKFVLPDLHQVVAMDNSGRTWSKTLARVDLLPANLSLRLAALLHDIGEGVGKNPEKVAARLAGKWLKSMTFDNKIIESVPHLIKENRFQCTADWSDAEIRRFMHRIGRESLPDLLELHNAVLQARKDNDTELEALNKLRDTVQSFASDHIALSVKELDIDGNELMRSLGLKSGPEVGKLLEELLDCVLENPDENKKARLIERAKERIGRIG
ncbi:MAG: CCA tRNA nucleotidyltransferase [Proteobacteria bacterium]|nr:CCA tRNA nucleotidyltransferase [Pseudomonadota bacterium]